MEPVCELPPIRGIRAVKESTSCSSFTGHPPLIMNRSFLPWPSQRAMEAGMRTAASDGGSKVQMWRDNHRRKSCRAHPDGGAPRSAGGGEDKNPVITLK